MKTLLFTAVLALVSGSCLGLGWWRSEGGGWDEPMASAAHARVRMPRETFAGYELTIVASAPKRAKVKTPVASKHEARMYCGDWRPLEQGSGYVQPCEVY